MFGRDAQEVTQLPSQVAAVLVLGLVVQMTQLPVAVVAAAAADARILVELPLNRGGFGLVMSLVRRLPPLHFQLRVLQRRR